MIVSPHMSPQLNETICGCRCGCGCGCAGHGNVDKSEQLSDSETAIDSSDSEDVEGLPPTQHTPDDGLPSTDSSHANLEILSPRAVSRQLAVWLLERLEDLQLGESSVNREQVFARPLLYEGNEDRIGDPLHGASSVETRSNAVSGPRNVPMVSPGPGIGGWLQVVPERTYIEHDQRVYISTPLRLSAEYQHARGKMVEHMLMPDKACVQEDLEQDWTAPW